MFDFKTKRVLVTGGTSGIGDATQKLSHWSAPAVSRP
jgi:NADP-dependent 3-hydroxy acid dehydrogenase YdfG